MLMAAMVGSAEIDEEEEEEEEEEEYNLAAVPERVNYRSVVRPSTSKRLRTVSHDSR